MPWLQVNGMAVHVRMGKQRQRRCSAPCEHGMGCSRPGSIQCDYQVAVGKTCDAYVCRAHATSVGPEIDHCPKHAGRQAGLFTGLLA
jgi:hypothetical protein